MACWKCHQVGHWVSFCPQDPSPSRSSTKSSLMMAQQVWSSPLQPATCHRQLSQARAKCVTGCGRQVQELLVDTGATYSVLTFSSQTCTILGATGKTITKIFTWVLLCCWDGHISPHTFLVVPECPTPLLGRDILTKLGTTLVMGSFSATRALQLLVTTEEPITLSPIESNREGPKTLGGQN